MHKLEKKTTNCHNKLIKQTKSSEKHTYTRKKHFEKLSLIIITPSNRISKELKKNGFITQIMSLYVVAYARK